MSKTKKNRRNIGQERSDQGWTSRQQRKRDRVRRDDVRMFNRGWISGDGGSTREPRRIPRRALIFVAVLLFSASLITIYEMREKRQRLREMDRETLRNVRTSYDGMHAVNKYSDKSYTIKRMEERGTGIMPAQNGSIVTIGAPCDEGCMGRMEPMVRAHNALEIRIKEAYNEMLHVCVQRKGERGPCEQMAVTLSAEHITRQEGLYTCDMAAAALPAHMMRRWPLGQASSPPPPDVWSVSIIFADGELDPPREKMRIWKETGYVISSGHTITFLIRDRKGSLDPHEPGPIDLNHEQLCKLIRQLEGKMMFDPWLGEDQARQLLKQIFSDETARGRVYIFRPEEVCQELGGFPTGIPSCDRVRGIRAGEHPPNPLVDQSPSLNTPGI